MASGASSSSKVSLPRFNNCVHGTRISPSLVYLIAGNEPLIVGLHSMVVTDSNGLDLLSRLTTRNLGL